MLTKWSKILFFVFAGIYLISKSFYQYFVFDMLVQYSVYAIIIAFFCCLVYNFSILKQQNKNILFVLPLLIIPYVVYNEMGNFYVYRQLDEEGYQKQEITLGANNGKEVQVLSGLTPGDRIVTRGAYQVKMASASAAIPGHTHEH